MPNRTPIKNHLQEIRLINQRSFIMLVMMFVLTFILICRLAYLQLVQHKMYDTLSQKNSMDLKPIEPTRGLIYDRNGVLLVNNIPVFSIDVIPDKVGNIPEALALLAKIIPVTDDEIAQFQKQLKQHRRFDEIPLKIRLTETEVAKFSENTYLFPGFLLKARLIRNYLFAEKLSHVLGYVGRINVEDLKNIDSTNYSASNYIGKVGIEKYYEDELHGEVGYEQVESDASGEPIRTISQINPTPGKNIYLTIDSNLQIAAEDALEGMRGAVVAIDPKTGQVLALVSQPKFDPNVFVLGISTEDFQKLQNSPDRPLYNRAIRGLYPLASTVKPFIALDALDSGMTTSNEVIYDPGWFMLNNSQHVFHDWRRGGHGYVNLNRALASSCDTYFFNMASRLGIHRIDAILTQFGFGELTGLDLEEEIPGAIASPEWKRQFKGQPWYEGDTMNSGIGQGYMQSTPLQLASAVATLANRGLRFTPYLLLKSQEPGKPEKLQNPVAVDKIKMREDTWQSVIQGMQSVINSPEGTGFRFGKTPYTVAAKTGTAQVYSFSKSHYLNEDAQQDEAAIPEKLRDHSLLIAFAPVNNPQIVLAIVVENSKQAINVARKVLDFYLLEE